jgi:AraC-like DNA-binding protein
MELNSFYLILLLTSLTLLLAQLAVRNKQLVHLVFAIFCGSIAMMVAKKLSADSIGPYQYLIGLGACATCNGYWLVSRALFRKHNPFSLRHVLVAALVGLAYMGHQGYLFIDAVEQINSPILTFADDALAELAGLLSTSLIVLAFWEGVRGFNKAQGSDKKQRIFYLASYASAVVVSTVISSNISSNPEGAILQEWVNTSAALAILLVTQTLIIWRFSHKANKETQQLPVDISSTQLSEQTVANNQIKSPKETVLNEVDLGLEQVIKSALLERKLFLQTNLKVADLARELNVSEYRVSRILHQQFDARNFNHFINKLRIMHAKTLLEDPSKQHWPVVVVGLESGFASVGPFTRAFKTFSGYTPNQYRQMSAFPQASN